MLHQYWHLHVYWKLFSSIVSRYGHSHWFPFKTYTFQSPESIFVGFIFYAEQQTGVRNEFLSLVSDTFGVDREKGTSDCVYSEVRVETSVARSTQNGSSERREERKLRWHDISNAASSISYAATCMSSWERRERTVQLVASHCTRQPGG
jgi:hypothetical protein